VVARVRQWFAERKSLLWHASPLDRGCELGWVVDFVGKDEVAENGTTRTASLIA